MRKKVAGKILKKIRKKKLYRATGAPKSKMDAALKGQSESRRLNNLLSLPGGNAKLSKSAIAKLKKMDAPKSPKRISQSTSRFWKAKVYKAPRTNKARRKAAHLEQLMSRPKDRRLS